MSKTMDKARRLYKLNSSEIRGLARYDRDRDEKLDELCRSRAFWLGDRWSQPASPPAQAALLVIRDRHRRDPLAAMAQTRTKIQPADLVTFLRIKTGLRGLWTRKVSLP